LMERFEAELRAAEPGFRELIGRIPLQATPPLPPEWLRCEMLERYKVLQKCPLPANGTVIEIGSGAHAISTVPLAFLAGRAGRVVAIERSRWAQFRPVVAASGMNDRIWPVAADARQLPLPTDSADLAVCLHGIRSMGGETSTVRILREMFRVAPRVSVAESLPVARTDAQRAHLAMYNLREEVFSAVGGHRDDLPYFPLDQLVSLVEKANGAVEGTELLEIDLPHFLAWFPRGLVTAIRSAGPRQALLRRWDEAESMRRRFGEDHPPVGIVTATRR